MTQVLKVDESGSRGQRAVWDSWEMFAMIIRSDSRGGHPTVAAILQWNLGLAPPLVREKYRRMRADLFAFFRGTNHLFAADWVSLQPSNPGPSIWICGDLHPKNFGCFRSDDGATVFDINDFDEAILAPCSVDLVRCATGIILGGEIWGHSPVRVMRLVLAYLDGYRAAIGAMTRSMAGDGDGTGASPTPSVVLAMKAAGKTPISELIVVSHAKTQAHLLDRLTEVDPNGERTLKRSGRFADVALGESKPLIEAVQAYGRSRGEPATFQVIDFASRMAGIGSLGIRRYVALVAGDGLISGHRVFDIKEGTEPSFREFAGPEGLLTGGSIAQARRIVSVQRMIQEKPTAGLDVLEVNDIGYRLRELIPVENRARLDEFRQETAKLRRGLDHAGWITAHAHLRGSVVGQEDRAGALAHWVDGSALDAVLAAAVRFADRNRSHYKAFRKAKLANPA